MDKWSMYWLMIAKAIKQEFGGKHPSSWEESTIEEFLRSFELRIKEIISKNEQLAENCGIRYKGKKLEHWRAMVPSTFRRIFSYRNNNGNRSTRNSFAIYLGYNSAEDFLKKNGEDAKAMLEREIPIINPDLNETWKKTSLDISRKCLARCMELGLDAALVSEAKRVINTHLKIYEAQLIINIKGITVEVVKLYRGVNVSENPKEEFYMQAFGDVPVDNIDLQLYAKDIIHSKKLSIQTDDRDLNTTKNCKIIFDPILEGGEDFCLELGYTLKDIAKLHGKDYLLSVLSFSESVEKYTAEIIFHDHYPQTIAFNNLLDDSEKIVQPQIIDEKYHFRYAVNDREVKNLNDMRLFIFYDREHQSKS